MGGKWWKHEMMKILKATRCSLLRWTNTTEPFANQTSAQSVCLNQYIFSLHGFETNRSLKIYFLRTRNFFAVNGRERTITDMGSARCRNFVLEIEKQVRFGASAQQTWSLCFRLATRSSDSEELFDILQQQKRLSHEATKPKREPPK